MVGKLYIKTLTPVFEDFREMSKKFEIESDTTSKATRNLNEMTKNSTFCETHFFYSVGTVDRVFNLLDVNPIVYTIVVIDRPPVFAKVSNRYHIIYRGLSLMVR
jgi:hypothetical protein